MFQRCLICTDFSDGLHRLVNFVPELAAGGLEQIVFLSSVPLWEEGGVPRVDEARVARTKERLAEATQNLPAGVDVQVEIPSGRPVEIILRALEQYDIDVVLTGTPIRSLLQEKLIGSTSMGLVRSTKTPITLLRPQLISTYMREELALRCRNLWHSLLIPYNHSQAARHSIEQIANYVRNAAQNSHWLQRCVLCWVVEDGGRREALADSRVQDAQKTLQSVKAELEALDLQVETQVRRGSPFVQIVEAASAFDISAIAISTDAQITLRDLTVPSVANELLRRSWYPVLTFPRHA